MKWIRFDREEPMNLDASSSQELKRIVVGGPSDEDLTASHVIPDRLTHAVRPQTERRELLCQPFDQAPV